MSYKEPFFDKNGAKALYDALTEANANVVKSAKRDNGTKKSSTGTSKKSTVKKTTGKKATAKSTSKKKK